MTTKELIEKLRKFDPDGNTEVRTHSWENEQGYNDAINYLSVEEDNMDGKIVLVINTAEIE